MKTKAAVFAFVTLLTCSLQATPPFPVGWANDAVMIQDSAGSGSGFFLLSSNKVYLITAKHVIFDEHRFPGLALLADTASVVFPNPDQSSTEQISIDLKASFSDNETRGHPTRDIAVVHCFTIDTNGQYQGIHVTGQLSKAKITMVAADQQIDLFTNLAVGTDAFTFGYPSSIGLIETNVLSGFEPLVHHGIIAGLDRPKRFIILDSPVYFGDSGGPVIERTGLESAPGGFALKFKVIGIAVQFIPFEEKWFNNRYHYANTTISNSGYSIAEPMDFVLEFLW